jgi:hypothetical protein
MVFERRTLPVATLSVDISFMSLWGGEANRAMVSLAGRSDRRDNLAARGISRRLHAAKTGAGFGFFQPVSEPGRRARHEIRTGKSGVWIRKQFQIIVTLTESRP